MENNFKQVTPTIVLNIKSKMQYLNPAQKSLAEYILHNFKEIEGMQISLLARNSEVSEATVSRFVKFLGYENYRAFQIEVARSEAAHDKSSLKGYAEVTDLDDTDRICGKIFEANIQALRDTMTVIDCGMLELVADLIVNARTICIFAQGRSTVTANSIRLRLYRLGIQCTLLCDPHEQATASSLMKTGDVALGISTFGRSKAVLNSIRRAAANGAKVIGVTSYQDTPLEKASHITLRTINNDEADFGFEPSCSSITQMVMLDCIYILVTNRMKESAEECFKATCEAIQGERE